MEKKKVNVGFEDSLEDDWRADKVERKRINVVLDEDIHRESVKLAARHRLDFSAFVNLMLEAALSAEEQHLMIGSMYATILRMRGYNVCKDPNSLKIEIEKRDDIKRSVSKKK